MYITLEKSFMDTDTDAHTGDFVANWYSTNCGENGRCVGLVQVRFLLTFGCFSTDFGPQVLLSVDFHRDFLEK